MTCLYRVCLLVFLAAPAGCVPPKESAKEEPAIDSEQYILAKEPSGAKGIREVRQKSRPGEEITVVGRIGGSARPFTKGRCSFTVIDLTVEPCDDDGCGNPWCSVKPDTLRQSVALVKFVDSTGKTLQADAKSVFAVEELSTVVVKGRASKDSKGNLVIVGSGLFVRP
jgi:hypothetical protein